MSNIQRIKEVVSAIINLQDHGDGCGCTICRKDAETVDKNIDIALAVMPLISK